MSEKEKYCKIGPVPKNQTRGSMLECAEKDMINYWGLHTVDKKTVKSLLKTSANSELNSLKSEVINLKYDILDMKKKYKKTTNKTEKDAIMKQMVAKNDLFKKKQKEIIEFKPKESEPEPEPEPEPIVKAKRKKKKEQAKKEEEKKEEEKDNEIEELHYHLNKLIKILNNIKMDYPNPKKHDELGVGNNNIYLNINTADPKQAGPYPMQYPIQPQPIQPPPTVEPPVQAVEPEQAVQKVEKKPAAKKKWAKVETVDPIKKIAPQKIDARTQNLKDKMAEELKKIKPQKVDEGFKSALAALFAGRR